jgi:hypothetical protein
LFGFGSDGEVETHYHSGGLANKAQDGELDFAVRGDEATQADEGDDPQEEVIVR